MRRQRENNAGSFQTGRGVWRIRVRVNSVCHPNVSSWMKLLFRRGSETSEHHKEQPSADPKPEDGMEERARTGEEMVPAAMPAMAAVVPAVAAVAAMAAVGSAVTSHSSRDRVRWI